MASCKTKQDKLYKCNYGNVKKYKYKYNIDLDIDKMFDTYTEEEWVDFLIEGRISTLPYSIKNDEQKAFKCFRYFISKYLKRNSREEILQLDTRNSVYNKLTFMRGYGINKHESFNDFIIKLYPEYNIKHYEFNIVKKGYFNNRENVSEYIKYFIEEVLNLSIENCDEYARYFSENVLTELGYNRIVHIRKDNKYKTYYHMLSDLFGEIIDEKPFKILEAFDGTIMDSNEEMRVYEFIKKNINKTITATNRSRGNSYVNNGERYIPDFTIPNGDKNVIIEYFGLYYEDAKSNILVTYKNKAERKIKYFNSLDNIIFVALYPCDLKNNFEGVREKLTSFIMQ